VSQFKNPRVGGIGVEPTNNGFVQLGVNRLYLWRSGSDH
jgi:hypothetical protein